MEHQQWQKRDCMANPLFTERDHGIFIRIHGSSVGVAKTHQKFTVIVGS